MCVCVLFSYCMGSALMVVWKDCQEMLLIYSVSHADYKKVQVSIALLGESRPKHTF